MKRILLTISSAFLAGGLFMAHAQNVSDLIISEVMAEPDSSSIMDDYGRRTGWIEIFNKSQGTVNYGGCFLSDDRSNLKKSPITKSDSRTKLGPRQVALFHASGEGNDGTFYVSFKVRNGSTIYLVSNDGRTIVDSISVPATLPAGKSVAKTAHDLRQMEFVTEPEPAVPTPGMVNGAGITETGSQKIAHEDKHGFILTLVSVSVVFCALIILWWLFSLLGKVSGSKPKSCGCEKQGKGKKSGELAPEVAAAITMALDQEMNGEVYAAIAAAVHLHMEDSVHDKESFVITIRKRHSSWNGKELGFRQLPK